VRDGANRSRLVSIVVPFLDESESLPRLWDELAASLRDRPEAFEFVFVDDGSTDDSPEFVRALAEQDPRVRLVRLSRNFGHQAALTAGLRAAAGEAVLSMDADLQHPPQLIAPMLERWHAGARIVQALRQDGPGWSAKRVLSRGFYRVFRAMCGLDLPAGAADFRLLDRAVLEGLLRFREPPFWRAMVHWAGFRQEVVRYTPPPRRYGTPRYTVRKSLGLALEALFAYSKAPIVFLWTLAGVAALVGILGVLDALSAYLLGTAERGWPSLMVTSGFLGAAILASLATIATYVERIHRVVCSRPLYLTRPEAPTRETRADRQQPSDPPVEGR